MHTLGSYGNHRPVERISTYDSDGVDFTVLTFTGTLKATYDCSNDTPIVGTLAWTR